MVDANTEDSVFPFPIPDGPPSVRPASAPFAFELSVSQRIVRDTSSTLQDLAREITARVPYPIIFIAGAAIGILVASIVVAITHHGRQESATTAAAATAQVAAPFEPQWAPLPVVTIHPAPPEPVATLPAPSLEVAKIDVAPEPIPARAHHVRRFVKAPRTQPRVVATAPTSAAARDLLADAL